MRKILTFDSLTYSINGADHVLRFDNRRDSFDCDGNRVLISQIAEIIGMSPGELRMYIKGLRDMRAMAKTEARDMARVRWFCGRKHRDRLESAVETEQRAGYVRALKAIDQMISKSS